MVVFPIDIKSWLAELWAGAEGFCVAVTSDEARRRKLKVQQHELTHPPAGQDVAYPDGRATTTDKRLHNSNAPSKAWQRLCRCDVLMKMLPMNQMTRQV
jgi:hypothetical protein